MVGGCWLAVIAFCVWFVVRCLLFVVCFCRVCLLLVVCLLLRVVCGSLFGFRCLGVRWLVVGVRCVLFVVRRVLLIVGCCSFRFVDSLFACYLLCKALCSVFGV